MEDTKKEPEVVLLLTAGIRKVDGEWEPTRAGTARLRATVEASGPGTTVLVVGGQRDDGPSEAAVYADTFKRLLFKEFKSVKGVRVDARARLTAPDLREYSRSGQMDEDIGVTEATRGDTPITVPVYPAFYRRVRLTLRKLGYRNTVWLPSEEIRHYPLPVEVVLYLVTLWDPTFEGGLLAPRIIAKANAERT